MKAVYLSIILIALAAMAGTIKGFSLLNSVETIGFSSQTVANYRAARGCE